MQRGGVERAAALGLRRGLADVLDAVQLDLLGLVEQRDRLRSQRLPAEHLLDVARRNELVRERDPERRLGGRRKPARDRRKLERLERSRVHAGQCTTRYLRSLFASMSNHIAKRVNWLPEIRSSATRTIVGVVIAFPASRSTTSTVPRTKPTDVIRRPSA